MRQQVVASDSTNMPERRLLGLAHRWLGELLLARGDAAGSLRELLSAREIHRELVAWDGANATWKLDLGVGTRLAGLGMLQAKQDSAALQALRESRAILAGLLERGADARDARLELARSETALATATAATRPGQSLTAAQAALAALEPLRDGSEADP